MMFELSKSSKLIFSWAVGDCGIVKVVWFIIFWYVRFVRLLGWLIIMDKEMSFLEVSAGLETEISDKPGFVCVE
jgi:hypothetical protein